MAKASGPHDEERRGALSYITVELPPNNHGPAVRCGARPIGRTQRNDHRRLGRKEKGVEAASHGGYAFEGAGGYFWNIFSTPLSRFLMLFLDLLDSVSLVEPRQISFLVLVSKRSMTKVPTL